MKNILKVLIFTAFLLLLASFSKCSFFPENEKPKELVIVSYNVCNLFDDVKNGTEYPEFDPSYDTWTSALYRQRLNNIAEIITAAEPEKGPDIICLQEIENKKVIKDLTTVWLNKFSYADYIAADNEGSAITTGIISKFPIKKTLNHSLYIKDFFGLRIITESIIDIDNIDFYIFNCHLKSKIGGDEETEPARIRAVEAIITRCKEIYLENPNAKIIIAGDLNENIDEYKRQNKKYLTAIMPLNEMSKFGFKEVLVVTGNKEELVLSKDWIVFYSPWLENNETGSYMYRGSWETIDHFLLAAPFFDNNNFKYFDFKVLNNQEFSTPTGAPLGWNSRTRSGYSDHFPIILFVRR